MNEPIILLSNNIVRLNDAACNMAKMQYGSYVEMTVMDYENDKIRNSFLKTKKPDVIIITEFNGLIIESVAVLNTFKKVQVPLIIKSMGLVYKFNSTGFTIIEV